MIAKEYFDSNKCWFWNNYFQNNYQFELFNNYDLLVISHKFGNQATKFINNNLEEITNSIKHYKNSGVKIIFNCIGEGFSKNFFDAVDSLVKNLQRKDVDLNDMFLLTGSLPISENIQNYKNVCNNFNKTKIPIICCNYYEIMAKKYIDANNLVFNKTITTRNKKFISMNGKNRSHRLMLTMLLMERNLLNNGHYSFHASIDKKIYKIIYKNFPNLYKQIEHSTEYLKYKFPMTLSKMHLQPLVHYCPEDIFYFNNAYFNIVQETNFMNNSYTYDLDSINYYNIFISEKTFRSFIYGIPFLCANSPYSLKGLQDYGYKTFGKIFNESYDSIDNNEERILYLIDEIERLCSISDKAWFTIYEELLPDLEYNFNKTKNADYTYLLG